MTLHLPESYTQLKESIFNAGSPKDLKSDKVHTKIIDTETCCKAEQTNSATNNMTKEKGNTKKKKKPVKRTTVRSLDVTCFKCGKVGHILRNCHSKKKNDSVAGLSSTNRPGSSTNAGLNVVKTKVDAEIESLIFCYFGAPENRLMDSGATDHMSPFGSNFKDYTAYIDSCNRVLLGDRSTRLEILGKGTIKRWVKTGPNFYVQLVWENVLHVDGIKWRFLSTSRFDDCGFTVTFSKSKLIIVKGNLKFSRFCTGPLYQVTAYLENPHRPWSLNLVTAIPIKTWHKRMGHLNWEAIKSVRQPPSTWHQVILLVALVMVVRLGKPNDARSSQPSPKKCSQLN